MDQLYRSVKPQGALRPYVRRILIADETTDIDTPIRPAPTGFNYLGWVFSGAVLAVVDGVTFPFAENCLHIAGQIQFQDITVRYSGAFGHILVEFEAAGFYELIPMSGAEIHGQAYSLTAGVHAWADALDVKSPYRDTQERVDRVQDFLCNQIPRARKAPGFISKAATLIEDTGGLIAIAEVARSLHISERGLSRHFKEVVGVAPKYFGRIVQLNRAMTAFSSEDKTFLAALAHDLGYSDQSHFNNSIRHFLHTSPQKFLDGDNRVMFEFLGRPS